MKTKRAKILLIDDNPKNLQVAMSILDKEGYDLIYAQDGKRGVELTQKNNFDLILLDVLMPRMDGYAVCKKLKSDPKTKNIPIIFLTVKDEEKDIIKGFECGGVDYVTKPFYTTVLLKRVKTHITLSQTTKELKNLNENLEYKVKEQVENIQLKDQMLFQQAKMASMGEMIANIAHQWRQPLTAISASTVVVKTKFATEEFDFTTENGVEKCKDYVHQKLSDIESYVTVLSTTIDDFRNFFKPQKELSGFTLQTCIQKSLKLLVANFESSDIKIIPKIDDLKIVGLENEFAQVLINLLNNAQDALLQNHQLDEKLIFINGYQNGDFAEISIKDNAGGIDKEIIDKIFEPYFTTKHQTQGTGIGLYMSQEIIQKHMQGQIEAKNISYKYENKEYNGAEFTIKIPLTLKN
jgi:C4-dicarboxylate-specific signal transduction histidine kinase